jgi:hypothetical protein
MAKQDDDLQIKNVIDQADIEIKKLKDEMAEMEHEDSALPMTPEKDSSFKFYREILNSRESKKTGNLSGAELGQLNHSVRRYEEMANLASYVQRPHFAEYMRRKGEIVSSTSMSKKGFFMKLIVTRIRQSKDETVKNNEKKSIFDFSKPKGEEE